MLQVIETTAPATAGANSEQRKCPGCGGDVAEGGRGTGRVFCAATCRTTFQNRMKAEGGVLAALIKAQTLTRHAKPGTREAEICTFARGQITQIAAYFNDRDEEEGRPSAVDYVGSLMDSGFIYMDRVR